MRVFLKKVLGLETVRLQCATMFFKPYHIDVTTILLDPVVGQCKKSLEKKKKKRSYFDPTLTEKVVAVKSPKS